MQNKINNQLTSIKDKPFMIRTVQLVATFWSMVLILAPAALSAYLLITTEDKVVVALGVLSAVFAAVNLVTTSFKANRPAQTSKKRK